MKAKHFLVVFTFLLLVIGCKKNPFDYRTKYIGKWNFTVHQRSWTLNGNNNDTTYQTVGTIKYGSESNELNFHPYENLDSKYVMIVTKKDSLIGKVSDPHQSGEGKFLSKKEVEFTFMANYLGGGGRSDVTGKKVK